MKVSIRIKFLIGCFFLLLIMAVTLSATSYALIKRDKQREFRQRAQIAVDIILDDFASRTNTYLGRVKEVLEGDATFTWTINAYHEDRMQIGLPAFIVDNLSQVAATVKKFGDAVSASRLLLYGTDKRLLVAFQHLDEQETYGVYGLSSTGENTYLPMNDPTQPMAEILAAENVIPDNPLPAGIATSYAGEIPDTIVTGPFNQERQLGIRIIAPVYDHEKKVGILVGEIIYNQSMVARYSALSKTEINFFARNQWSVGTLPAQTQLQPEILENSIACQNLREQHVEMAVASVPLNDQHYYQGSCVFKDAQETVGALTISLSQAIEKQEIRKILTTTFTISIGLSVIILGLTAAFIRTPIDVMPQLVAEIDRIASGDIPDTMTTEYAGAINPLESHLNVVIETMRGLFHEIQSLNEAVQHGKLETRGNVEAFAGIWQEIVIGVNSLIDSFVVPNTRMTQSFERIAEGDIAETITEEFGALNRIKHDLILMIQRLREIVMTRETRGR